MNSQARDLAWQRGIGRVVTPRFQTRERRPGRDESSRLHPHPSTECRPPVIALVASAGGLPAFLRIVSDLPADFCAPLLVVQHDSRPDLGLLPALLRSRTRLPVEMARSGDRLRAGTIHLAPGGHHLTFAPGGEFELHSVALVGRVDFVCPSIDVLFESMARVYGPQAVGVVLSGMGRDGAAGSRALRAHGGLVIAESEASARYHAMPAAVVDLGRADLILPASKIAPALEFLAAATTD